MGCNGRPVGRIKEGSENCGPKNESSPWFWDQGRRQNPMRRPYNGGEKGDDIAVRVCGW